MQIRVTVFTLTDAESEQAVPLMMKAIAGSADIGAIATAADEATTETVEAETAALDGESFSWPMPAIAPAEPDSEPGLESQPAVTEDSFPVPAIAIPAQARTVRPKALPQKEDEGFPFPEPRIASFGSRILRALPSSPLPKALFWGSAVGALLTVALIVGLKLREARVTAESTPEEVESVVDVAEEPDCSASEEGAIAPECEEVPPNDASDKAGVHGDPPPTRRKGALEK